jgi:hypothetical protein
MNTIAPETIRTEVRRHYGAITSGTAASAVIASWDSEREPEKRVFAAEMTARKPLMNAATPSTRCYG